MRYACKLVITVFPSLADAREDLARFGWSPSFHPPEGR